MTTDEWAWSVRRVVEADWPVLKALRLEALADAPDAFGTTYAEAARRDDGWWRESVTRPTFFVEREGVAVGMAAGGYQDDRPGTHWLYGMYVTPSARGTGAAARVVDAVCEWARDDGARELFLRVTSTQSRARAFYEKMGFVDVHDPIRMSRDRHLTLLLLRKDLGG